MLPGSLDSLSRKVEPPLGPVPAGGWTGGVLRASEDAMKQLSLGEHQRFSIGLGPLDLYLIPLDRTVF